MIVRAPHFGHGGRKKLRLGYKHKIKAPESSEDCIVFPVNKKDGYFERSVYDPEMTNGRISEEEIANVLRELDAIARPIFNPRLESCLRCFKKSNKPLFFALWCLTFLTFIFGNYIKEFDLFMVVWFLGMTFFITTFLVIIFNCFYIGVIKLLLWRSKKLALPIIEDKNPDFLRKGYYWAIPQDFPYWVELWGRNFGERTLRVPILMMDDLGEIEELQVDGRVPILFSNIGRNGGYGGMV